VERPKGIAVAQAGIGAEAPVLLQPARGWSRSGVVDWLMDHATARTDMLVGMDLSFGLPFEDRGAFFPGWPKSPPTAEELWRQIDDACIDDPHLGVGSFLRRPAIARYFRHQRAEGDLFGGGTGRLRRCERRMRDRSALRPSSCFNLVGAGQVGKASLTGMRVLNRLRDVIPVWPFDPLPAFGPVIVEIYTTIAARAAGLGPGRSKIRDAAALDDALARLGSAPHASLTRYDDHATDAIVSAVWLRRHAEDPVLWHPPGLAAVANTEGWTFGVT